MPSAARLSLVVLCVAACASPTEDGSSTELGIDSPLPEAASAEDWKLTWADEFDSIDESKWAIWVGSGRHATVLNSSTRDTVESSDGALVVSAKQTPDDPDFKYAAGYMSTNGTFAQTYGKVEFRLRGEFAPGLWYAVWGRPWASNAVPEIDIEFLGKNTSQVWLVNHWALPPIQADDRRRFTTVNGFDFTEWHTYAVTWSPTLVEWLIDGKPYMRVDDQGVPHEPMFWTINCWVGAWGGTPLPTTQFPSHFQVDYFHVYRPAKWLTDPQIRIMNPRTKIPTDGTLNVALADFDEGARVEVWEGEKLVDTLATPPFKWRPNVPKGQHALTFKGTDGTREASTTVDLNVY